MEVLDWILLVDIVKKALTDVALLKNAQSTVTERSRVPRKMFNSHSER